MATDSLRTGLYVIILASMMPSRMRSKRMSMNMPTTQRSKSNDRSVYVGHSLMGECLRKFRILALLGRLEEEPEFKHLLGSVPNSLMPCHHLPQGIPAVLSQRWHHVSVSWVSPCLSGKLLRPRKMCSLLHPSTIPRTWHTVGAQ